MKKIVITTDFSSVSKRAIEIIDLFDNMSELEVTFLNISEKNNTKEHEEAFAKFLDENADGKFKGLRKRNIVSIGNYLDAINDYVGKFEIDLIIIASKIKNSFEDYISNSHCMKMIRTVNCPIISFVDKAKAIQFKNVTFISDFSPEMLNPFKKLTKLLENNDLVYSLIKINNLDKPNMKPQEFKKMLHPFTSLIEEKNLGIVYEQKCSSVSKGIELVTEIFDIDLISVATHFRDHNYDFYEENLTESFIYDSKVPVITIPVDNQ